MSSGETHTKRVVSASEVPLWIRKKIDPQAEKNDRMGRKNFILCLIFFNIISAIILAVAGWILGLLSETLAMIAVVLGSLFSLLVNIVFFVNRCHDLNKSGWWILCMFVPYLNVLFFLYLCLVKGTEGDNDYGPPET